MTSFPPDFDRFGEARAKYGVEIRQAPSGTLLVILDELAGDRGTTVAGVFEHLATELYRNYFTDRPAWNIVWVLRHPPVGSSQGREEEAYEQILLEWDGHHFRSPRRIALPRGLWGDLRLDEGLRTQSLEAAAD